MIWLKHVVLPLAILCLAVALEAQLGAGPKPLAEYDYTVQEDGQQFTGRLIKIGPKQWSEKADKFGTGTNFFEEISGEDGWITLYDAHRHLYARLRPNQYGPLETSSDNKTWGSLPWPLTPVIKEQSITSTRDTPDKNTWDDKKVATAFGIAGVVVMLILAIFFPQPTPFQYTVFRIVLALVGAGVGATIPGLINLDYGAVRASGAIAIFAIVYFFSPANLVSHPA